MGRDELKENSGSVQVSSREPLPVSDPSPCRRGPGPVRSVACCQKLFPDEDTQAQVLDSPWGVSMVGVVPPPENIWKTLRDVEASAVDGPLVQHIGTKRR